MSFQICISPEVNCVFAQHIGFVPGEGLAAVNEAISRDVFRPGMSFMRDTRQMSLPEEFDFAWFKKDFQETYEKEHALLQGTKFA